jgi:Kdo2-lipid IVA lauroyltransferase/acyltransferase
MSMEAQGRVGKDSVAHTAEYLALRGIVTALTALPWQRAGRLGARLGTLGFRPLGIRRDVVESQLRAAFPALDDREILRISRASYAHLGRTAIETALLPSLGRSKIIDLCDEITGWNHIEDGVRAGRGIILVTGHLGNWELGGAYLAARGIPVDAIVRHMANPRFDRYLNLTRASLGIRVVYDDQAVRQTPRALREGRLVAFLADQGVRGLASTFVPFFGRPAKTPRGAAVFALRLDAPVLFGAAIRQPNGRYHMAFEPVEVTRSGDRERDTDDIVARYTLALERWVRIAPEQYLWQHRRWRRQPPGAPVATAEPG